MSHCFERSLFTTLLCLTLGTGCGGSDRPYCDATELENALDAAMPGDTVTIGACRISGKFRVPRGVTLTGAGAALSTIASTGTALIFDGDDATIAEVTIENGTGHGVVGIMHDHLTVRGVVVRSALGRAALGFAEVPNLTLTDVVVTGPVTAANASSVPMNPRSTQTALMGIALHRVGTATLQNVQVSGFGGMGFAAEASETSWTSGSATGNLGIGVWLFGGTTALDGVAVSGTLHGIAVDPTYGIFTADRATLRTVNCRLSNTAGGIGAAHLGGSVTHTGLTATGHEAGAILAHQMMALAISGATFSDNGLAAIVAVESSGVSITDTTIRMTHLRTALVGPAMIGDGVQIVHPMPGTVLRDLTLDGNERVGVLLDLGGGDTSTVVLDAVDVTSADAALGCVVQNGTPVTGWDASVVRHGAATTNDAAFTGPLDVASVVPSLPSAGPDVLRGFIATTD